MLNTISVAPSSLFDDLLCFAEAGIDGELNEVNSIKVSYDVCANLFKYWFTLAVAGS